MKKKTQMHSAQQKILEKSLDINVKDYNTLLILSNRYNLLFVLFVFDES